MVKIRQIAIVLFWNIVTHVINDDESLTNQIPRLQTYKRKSAFLSPVFWIVKVIKRGVVQNTPSSLVLHRQQFLTYRLKTNLLVGFKWFWLFTFKLSKLGQVLSIWYLYNRAHWNVFFTYWWYLSFSPFSFSNL